MAKNIILLISTFAIVSIAFVIYQWRESPPPPPRAVQTVPNLPTTRPALPRSTQPAARLEDRSSRSFTGDFGQLSIPPGENPKVHVFNEETGETKYVFQATRWEPIGASGTEFAMTDPSAEIVLPKGQKAYVRADYGQVTVQRGDKNRIDPKRGWFKGNVRIIVDKTSQKDRKADPRLNDPSTHPETVYKCWLEDVSFDLDLAHLQSEGVVKVQSADATLEGRGLELVWNEVNRRITKLRIVEGRRATFRSSKLMDFSVGSAPTADKKKEKDEPAGSPAAPVAAAPPSGAQPADGNRATPDANTTFGLINPGARPSSPKENRIDSYRIVFRDNIVAEQRDGVKTIGRLKAAVIEVLFEVGQAEREAVQQAPGSQPAERPPKASPAETAPTLEPSPLEEGSTLVLNWTGEMIVVPERPTETPESQKTGTARSPRLTATGNPVEIYSWGRDAGDATCQQLDYDAETKQVRLTGTPESPVRMKSGPNGELFGEKVFFDGKTGFAKVEGPGWLVTTRKPRSEEPEMPECISQALQRYADTQPTEAVPAERQPRVLTWEKFAQIQFDVYVRQVRDKETGELESEKNPYLKHAVLDGGVTFQDANQSMAAEYLEVFFRAPESGVVASRETFIADRVLARGNIRMTNKGDAADGDNDELICDALDLQLDVDPLGNNVPRTGRATGNVIARQGRREIRARDEIVVTLGLGPQPISPEKRKRLEAAARECGYSPDSSEWKEFESKRRRLTILAMTARGDVTVRDPKETLDVVGKELDCTFDEQRRLTRASIVGDKIAPAHAETGDFYIRGPQILMDVSAQSAQVPGAGMLRFYTSQDLDGRPVDKPIPVVVTWSGRMALDGQGNTGLFAGEVRVRSDNSTLDCRELMLKFQNVPPPASPQDGVRSVWPVRLFTAKRRQDRSGVTVGRVSGELRKRLAYLHASGSPADAKGDARIEMKVYEEAPPVKGLIARALVASVPDWLPRQAQSPKAAAQQRRLVSGAYLSGREITINLIEEHLIVQGRGDLLIRDYRVPARRGPAQPDPAMSLMLGDTAGGSLTGYSPGHTVFRWQNGMSFFNQKNLAVFDREVMMAHQSGSELQMTPELAAVTGLTAETLAGLKGRKVGMTTDHLIVEFQRAEKARGTDPATLSRATRLKAFNATGRVRLQDGGNSIEGAEITYSDETGIARVNSSARSPAQVVVVNEKTGALQVEATGEFVEWNVKTQKARVRQPRAFAPGR